MWLISLFTLILSQEALGKGWVSSLWSMSTGVQIPALKDLGPLTLHAVPQLPHVDTVSTKEDGVCKTLLRRETDTSKPPSKHRVLSLTLWVHGEYTVKTLPKVHCHDHHLLSALQSRSPLLALMYWLKYFIMKNMPSLYALRSYHKTWL